jgi:hypothetical protein
LWWRGAVQLLAHPCRLAIGFGELHGKGGQHRGKADDAATAVASEPRGRSTWPTL